MTLQFNNENPDVPRIIRYLLLVYIAKNTSMFRSYGKELDSSVYFTLYGLGKIAESLKGKTAKITCAASNHASFNTVNVTGVQ
jgi:hypothetical protein